jgi:DNA-binding LacI/PurR family transcriptional regulator
VRVRLKDVALRAGVSVKTVSNVVNGYEHVTDRTRSRVKQALDELGYRPNLSARSLRTGRTGLIAIAVPRLDQPYFAELAGCVVRAAERHGLTVLIDQTDGLPDRERLVVSGIRPHLIDGLIFSPLALGKADLLAADLATPLVLLGERIFDGGADHVAIDNVAAAQVATEHLIDLGRRRIAAIGAQGFESGQTAHLRLAGYREALSGSGMAEDPQLIAAVDAFHRADGAEAMSRLLELDDPPDAVFCFNDLLALGALRTLHERGLAVPGDVAVVGFDDIDESRYSVPALTTVSPDKQQIADVAVDALVHRLGPDKDDEPRELRTDFVLAARESSLGRQASVGGSAALMPGRGVHSVRTGPRWVLCL